MWFVEIEHFKRAKQNRLRPLQLPRYFSFFRLVLSLEHMFENVCLSVSPSQGLNPLNPSLLDCGLSYCAGMEMIPPSSSCLL